MKVLFNLLIFVVIIPICLPLKGIVNIDLISDKCFHHSIGHIFRCQLTFQQSIQKSINKRPFNVNVSQINERQLKTVCCGLWDVISCIKGAAIKWSNCRPSILEVFYRDIEDIKHQTDYHQCNRRFREGSIGCGFPVWATITLVVISIVVVAVVTCFVHRICNTINTNRDRSEIRLIQH